MGCYLVQQYVVEGRGSGRSRTLLYPNDPTSFQEDILLRQSYRSAEHFNEGPPWRKCDLEPHWMFLLRLRAATHCQHPYCEG